MKNITSIITRRLEIEKNRISNIVKIKRIDSERKNKTSYNNLNKVSEAIILVHTGSRPVPEYVKDCIQQIRLFDKSIPIYFVCSKKTVSVDHIGCCIVIYEEDLLVSDVHLDFLRKVSKMQITKFFQVTIERFFVVYDAMQTLGIDSCLHLENDNLLYVCATDLMRRLSKIYYQIATPRAWLKISYASIMYIPTQKALMDFLEYINCGSQDVYFNDMELLPTHVDTGRGMTLPVVFEEYSSKYGLKLLNGDGPKKTEKESDYSNFSKELEGIFDCACLGQYLDGCDFIYHPDKRAGYINEEAYIDARNLPISWVKEDNLYVPYVEYCQKKYRVFNLHIHSKRLGLFRSDCEEIGNNT
ncbi:MAG: hypothetical protein IKI75_08305 [Lachnospiraceae bacterium]|nr:hypothetical protein [Lachnospiraceae bacterium]